MSAPSPGLTDLIRSIHVQLLAARDMGLVTDRQIFDVLKALTAEVDSRPEAEQHRDRVAAARQRLQDAHNEVEAAHRLLADEQRRQDHLCHPAGSDQPERELLLMTAGFLSAEDWARAVPGGGVDCYCVPAPTGRGHHMSMLEFGR